MPRQFHPLHLAGHAQVENFHGFNTTIKLANLEPDERVGEPFLCVTAVELAQNAAKLFLADEGEGCQRNALMIELRGNELPACVQFAHDAALWNTHIVV